MQKSISVFLLLFACCTPVRKVTYKAEEAHNALYRQKALIVYDVTHTKVLLTNPPATRCYFLKGREYVSKWHAGDTMVIDSNLTDFFNIRFTKCDL